MEAPNYNSSSSYSNSTDNSSERSSSKSNSKSSTDLTDQLKQIHVQGRKMHGLLARECYKLLKLLPGQQQCGQQEQGQ